MAHSTRSLVIAALMSSAIGTQSVTASDKPLALAPGAIVRARLEPAAIELPNLLSVEPHTGNSAWAIHPAPGWHLRNGGAADGFVTISRDVMDAVLVPLEATTIQGRVTSIQAGFLNVHIGERDVRIPDRFVEKLELRGGWRNPLVPIAKGALIGGVGLYLLCASDSKPSFFGPEICLAGGGLLGGAIGVVVAIASPRKWTVVDRDSFQVDIAPAPRGAGMSFSVGFGRGSRSRGR